MIASIRNALGARSARLPARPRGGFVSMHARSDRQTEGVQVISREQLTNMVASGTGRVVGSAGERLRKVAQVFLETPPAGPSG